MRMTQYRLVFRGSVQGVGFRENFRQIAKREGIKGWIRNLKDNQVEAVVQVENLEAFIDKLRHEQFFRGMQDLQQEEQHEEAFSGFEIRY